MSEVLVYAFLRKNFGDDLMVSILCRRYPHITFCVWADADYRAIYRDIENVKICTENGKLARMWDRFCGKFRIENQYFFQRLVRKTGTVVQIGGSIYMQQDGYMNNYYLESMMQLESRSMYLCGANFGPYRDEAYYQQYHELLGKYSGICFRDRYSYRLFQDLANARYAADTVFSYQDPPDYLPVQEKKQVLISVMQLRERALLAEQYAEDYQRFLVKTAECYLEKGYQVKFISLCGEQGDGVAIREIETKIFAEKQELLSEYFYTGNLRECVRVFDESEIVIGTRLHSIILGWLRKKKVLPIVYDEKTQHILDDNQRNIFVRLDQLKDADIEELTTKIERMPQEQLEHNIESANEQFKDLDQQFKAGGDYTCKSR